jgi:hypothetical protein
MAAEALICQVGRHPMTWAALAHSASPRRLPHGQGPPPPSGDIGTHRQMGAKSRPSSMEQPTGKQSYIAIDKLGRLW